MADTLLHQGIDRNPSSKCKFVRRDKPARNRECTSLTSGIVPMNRSNKGGYPLSTALMAFILAGMAPLHGQDQPATPAAPGPIATDRPAVTNSSVVVPAGSFQAENGFLETSSQGQGMVDGPETLLRIGVATRTELRFTAPDYYYNLNTTGGLGLGFGDFGVGVKEQLGPTPGGFDVSAILS
jgi:hypothetical protein